METYQPLGRPPVLSALEAYRRSAHIAELWLGLFTTAICSQLMILGCTAYTVLPMLPQQCVAVATKQATVHMAYLP